jgi:hypothetical protein
MISTWSADSTPHVQPGARAGRDRRAGGAEAADRVAPDQQVAPVAAQRVRAGQEQLIQDRPVVR